MASSPATDTPTPAGTQLSESIAEQSFTDWLHSILSSRLHEVVKRLKPAVKRYADDLENVHELRIATRRAVAAIETLEPSFIPCLTSSTTSAWCAGA